MFSRYFSTLAVLAFAGAGSAQLLMSQSCQSAALGIFTSNSAASQCINGGGLLDLVVKLGENTSLVQPVTNWVSGLSSAGACTNETLAAGVRTVASGCSADLALNSLRTDEYISFVQGLYPTVRKVVSLKDSSSNNDFCITQGLKTLERVTGFSLTLTNILNYVSGVNFVSGINVSASDVCTSCSKAMYIILKQDFPQYFTSDAVTTVQGYCGANFTDGQVPSTIQSRAVNGTVSPSPSAAAMSFSAGLLGAVASSIFAVMAGFVFLA